MDVTQLQDALTKVFDEEKTRLVVWNDPEGEFRSCLADLALDNVEILEGDVAAATSTSRRKKLVKERDTLLKQRVELQAFDEKLRHYADQRIHLDLDDGVKVNYGRFGDLLAEVKAITGKKPA